MTTKQEIEEIVQRPYTIELEYGGSAEDGVLAYLADWPDCFAAGRTREEAVAELGKVMRALIRYRLEEGLEIPEPLTGYGGRVLVRMPRTLHRDVDARAKREGVSLNQWVTSAIARAIGPVGDAATALVEAISHGGRGRPLVTRGAGRLSARKTAVFARAKRAARRGRR